jgi:hypothetical protein
VRAAAYATGTVATPATADSERIPASPKPNTRAHSHAIA